MPLSVVRCVLAAALEQIVLGLQGGTESMVFMYLGTIIEVTRQLFSERLVEVNLTLLALSLGKRHRKRPLRQMQLGWHQGELRHQAEYLRRVLTLW